jgi:excisionase family DNA binding protein
VSTTEALAYKIPEAAKVAGVSQDTIRRAIRKGDLAAKYPTSHAVIMRDELEAWLRSTPSEPPGSAS